MKTSLATLIAAALLVPATTYAGSCGSKGYHKYEGARYYQPHHPHANYYRQHRYDGYQHGKKAMKHPHHGYSKHGYGYGYAIPHHPYHHGANMYLHLPEADEAKSPASKSVEPVVEPELPEATPGELRDIVVTASAVGQFNTLLEALKAAGLEETLTGPGPFTVFAPTDEAFAQLPESILNAVKQDPAALTDLLTSHVVSGRVTAADAKGLEQAETVQGSVLAITHIDGISVNGAKVISADIEASNGVIHVIDSVIFPRS